MVQGVLVGGVRVLQVVDHEVAVGQLLPRVAVLVIERHGLLKVLHGLRETMRVLGEGRRPLVIRGVPAYRVFGSFRPEIDLTEDIKKYRASVPRFWMDSACERSRRWTKRGAGEKLLRDKTRRENIDVSEILLYAWTTPPTDQR